MSQRETEDIAAISSAMFSLHYRALEAMHVDWVRAKPVAKLPPELEPLSAEKAAEVLMSGLDKLSADDGLRLSQIHAHSAAIVAWAVTWGGSRTPSALPALEKAYDRLMRGRPRIGSMDSPTGTYLAQLADFGVKCINNFDLAAEYDLDLERTTVTVAVDAQRLVTDFATLVDPQNWALVAPIAFTASYVFVGESPNDVDVDPTQGARATSPWERRLFEAARLALSEQGALTLSQFRNVLHIDYKADIDAPVAVPKITVNYRLVENLTQRVLHIPSLGGIDIDSGYVSVADNGGNNTLLEATKSFRFAAPPGLRQILNWMNLPFLVTWMLFYVVGGACAPALRVGDES